MEMIEEAPRPTELEDDPGDSYRAPDLQVLPGGAGSPARDIEPAEYAPLVGTERAVGDLEAAVALVHDGFASRIVLAGFPSWPGLLWYAYELAATNNVLILPAVARPGGQVDIVITNERAVNG